MAIALYVTVGAWWLPVVWLQIRMRHLAEAADQDATALLAIYKRYACG